MYEVLDHPDIRRAMATGYAHKSRRITHYCPKCGVVLDAKATLYLDDDGEVTNCDQCIEKTTVDEYYDA